MSDLGLPAGLRANLLAIARAEGVAERAAGRLASGLRVQGPADDLAAFLQARALLDAAEAVDQRRPGLVQALQALRRAEAVAAYLATLLDAAERQLAQARLQPAAPAYEPVVAFGAPLIAIEFNRAWDALLVEIEAATAEGQILGDNLVGDVDPRVAAFAPTARAVPAGPETSFALSGVFLGNPVILDRRSAGLNEISLISRDLSADYAIGAGDVAPLYDATPLATPQRPTTRIDARTQPVGTQLYRYRVVDFAADVRQVQVFQDAIVAPNTIAFGAAPIDGALFREIPRIGLGLLPAAFYDGFLTTRGREGAQYDLDRAKSAVAAAQASFGTQAAALEVRIDQLDALARETRAGADKLIVADLNAEGATLVASQTLSRLGVAAAEARLDAAAGVLALLERLNAAPRR